MDLSSLLGGGGAAPAGSTGIGGSGKGASGAASVVTTNFGAGDSSTNPWLIGGMAFGALALILVAVTKIGAR